MKKSFSSALLAIAAAAMLTACGGGGDSDLVFEDDDPSSSGRSGRVVVTGADTAANNGIYTSDDVFLNDVEKFNPIGSDPEFCRFRFERLAKAGDDRRINGDIRYSPDTDIVRVVFLTITRGDSITGVEYTLPDDGDELRNAVNRGEDRIDLAGVRMVNGNDTITLTGSIPMRRDRPSDC